MKIYKNIKRLLPMVGILILVYLLWSIDLSKIIEIFLDSNKLYLLLMPPFIFLLILLRGFKWKAILDVQKLNYTLKKSCIVWCIGLFVGTLTPAKSGDVIRAFYLKSDTQESFGKCLSSVVMDRLFDILTILLLAIASFVTFSIFYKINLSLLYVISIACAFIFIYLFTKKNFITLILRLFFYRFAHENHQNKVKEIVNDFYSELGLFGTGKVKTIYVFILTMICWVVQFLHIYVIGLMINVNVSFFYVVIVMPIVFLVELIPISIFGIGTREATLILFFSLIGLGKESAVAFSMMYWVLEGWVLDLVGGLFLVKNPYPELDWFICST